ncbi:hypothetical protein GGQ54_000764 [Naumannella cuiyingiana]|uniref:DUF7878 domain-containing protein n=1 Tax=Naumannella cuiyingiana TaxID=1347891 RepID=A0A7Z0IK33_9ACTN|nr:hypothetical protein [Naumannella cuiyingiana]NYI70204.1 hypothetical protein [Naumannella cuiyingiana]
MATISLSFSDTAFRRGSARNKFDLLLGVEGTLQLAVGDRLVYSEPMFPVVELRHALASWLRCADSDFEFISMESDEPGLLWFRQQPSGRWRAGSIHQDDIAVTELNLPAVEAGCYRFIEAVDQWVRENLGVEVEDVLGADDV